MAKRRHISVNTPGWQPDWQSLIQTDPTYQQYQLGQQAQSTADKASRNTGIFQQLAQFGAVPPGGLGDLGDFQLTPEQVAAIGAGTQAGTSDVAQMQRAHDKNIQDLQDMLAARGVLRSGALGVGLNQEQTRYATDQQAQREKLLGVLAGLQAAFAQAESGRATDLSTQAQATADRLQQSGLYKPKLSQKVQATRVGNNLYRDADGNYYDRNGNTVDLAARALHGGRHRTHGRYGPGNRP